LSRSVVFSTNKTDSNDMTEILLKVMLNIITLTPSRVKLIKFVQQICIDETLIILLFIVYFFFIFNHIGGIMVGVLASSAVDRGCEPDRVKLKTIKLVFVANFQWDVDEVRFVLDQHAELDFYSANSLKQQSAGKHISPHGHIILLYISSLFSTASVA
jgi:hypothetical protein